ncbi:MAG: Hint domain-containing protein, partial [Halocynthiibacter sp.]
MSDWRIKITPDLRDYPVVDARILQSTSGANIGDSITHADAAVLNDVYKKKTNHPTLSLKLNGSEALDTFAIHPETEVGTPNATVVLDAALTFQSDLGHIVELLTFVELDSTNSYIQNTYFLMLSPLEAQREYELIGLDVEHMSQKLALFHTPSFVKGTPISLADGRDVPVCELKEGDIVQTLENGPQTIRHITHQTTRGIGCFAPIYIAAGS